MQNKDTRRVLPSQRCPTCGAWVDKAELSANGGKCNHCTPDFAAGITIRTDGTTNTGFEVSHVEIY